MEICSECGEHIVWGEDMVWDCGPMHLECAGPEYDPDGIYEEDEP